MNDRVDYGKIANRYDHTPVRREVAPDSELRCVGGAASPLRVLDLACGTGAYLSSQAQHHATDSHGAFAISCFGCDPSEAMLAVARTKLAAIGMRAARLSVARAEALPYAEASFD